MTMTTCPACGEQTAAGKFCQHCGKPLPAVGGNSGDIVATRSTVYAGTTFVSADPAALGAERAKCPICGRRNKPEDTFECRKCGRDYLCAKHQDPATF